MKIEKSAIIEKLTHLKRVATAKADLAGAEWQRGILLKDGKLIANNLTTALITPVDSRSDECFIIPLKAIEMIEKLPDGEIEIALNDNGTLSVKTSGVKSKFSTYPAEKFSLPEEFEAAKTVHIEGDDLQGILISVFLFIPQQFPREVCTGMLFDADGEKLAFVGGDSYKIIKAEIPCADKFNIIVPRASVQMLIPLIEDDSFEIRTSRKGIQITTGDFTLISRQIYGSYPPYEKLLKGYGENVEVDRRAMMDSLNRLLICYSEKHLRMAVLQFADGEMSLSTHASANEYADRLEITGGISCPDRFAYDARLLLDCFKVYDGDTIRLSLLKPLNPVFVDDGKLQALVMAMKIME